MAVRRWNYAHSADVVITVGMVYDRYAVGEVMVKSLYYGKDGTTRVGDSHRVALGPGARRAVPQLWDALFDEVLCVQQQRPGSLKIRVNTTGMDGWQEKVTTVVRLVAHELQVPVKRVKPKR